MMRYILPTISMAFFGQIFNFLILLYLCEENEDKTKYNYFKCPNGTAFYHFIYFLFYVLLLLFYC